MRFYNVNFQTVTVSAAQDLVQITGPSSGKLIKVFKVWLQGSVNTSLPTGQGLDLRCRYMPATFTIGSGGTTGITPSKEDQGDAACSTSTCAVNNTVKGTTSGTAVVPWSGGTHCYSPWEWTFSTPIVVNPSTAFVFELISTVSGTVVMSGGCRIGEEG